LQGCVRFMKSINHLKIFGIVVAIFVVLFTIGFTMQGNRTSTLPERVIRDSLTIVQDGYLSLTDTVRRLGGNVRDLFHTFEENRILRGQLFNYESQNARLSQLEEENAALRELADTGQTLLETAQMTATVIMRDPTTWHNFMLINKGRSDGVVEDMSVLSRQGYLVGQVTEVYERSSRIQLMNHQNQSSNVAASVHRVPENGHPSDQNRVSGANGLFQGFDASTGELIMALVPRDVEIEEGDWVMTNGLGGVTASGILIGYVERTELSADGLTQTLYLRNEADFNQLDFVLLVQRLARGHQEVGVIAESGDGEEADD